MDFPSQMKVVNPGLAREERRGSEVKLLPGLPDAISIQSYEELLPGLPDAISIHIATKLSWKNLLTLSLVGPQWRRAIRSRTVYNARDKSNPTTKHIFIGHRFEGRLRLSMYSVEDDKIYHLPGVPVEYYRWRQSSCLWLDGKVYSLGGHEKSHRRTCDVFAFDVVGYGEWEKCANMNVARANSLNCVAKGKIYVADGSRNYLVEVYDPCEDSWRGLSALKDASRGVFVVGDEIFWTRYSDKRCDVYDIRKNEFGQSARFVGSKFMKGVDDHRIIIAGNGKLHKVRSEGQVNWLEVYDVPTDSWILSPLNPSPREMTDALKSFFELAVKRHRWGTCITF